LPSNRLKKPKELALSLMQGYRSSGSFKAKRRKQDPVAGTKTGKKRSVRVQLQGSISPVASKTNIILACHNVPATKGFKRSFFVIYYC